MSLHYEWVLSLRLQTDVPDTFVMDVVSISDLRHRRRCPSRRRGLVAQVPDAALS
jgi:hypothetical protein